MSTVIAQLEREVRDRINAPRLLHQLLQRKEDWNRLCSALDVIGDTELALDSYLGHAKVEDTGTQYLHVYGALQILQTQQDAVASVCAALQISPKAPPRVPLIRNIRSSAIAHPTFQREDKSTRSNFIGRHSLSQYGFTLETTNANGPPYTRRSVDIPSLIKLQRVYLSSALSEVISMLDQTETKHRKTFRQEKLASCFPTTLDYYFEKISEGIHTPSSSGLGKMGVDSVSECLFKMKVMLQKRGEWGIRDSVSYEYDLLQYPVEQLGAFFADPAQSKLSKKDAYIFRVFLQERIKTLIQIAREIDDTYQSSPTTSSTRSRKRRKR